MMMYSRWNGRLYGWWIEERIVGRHIQFTRYTKWTYICISPSRCKKNKIKKNAERILVSVRIGSVIAGNMSRWAEAETSLAHHFNVMIRWPCACVGGLILLFAFVPAQTSSISIGKFLWQTPKITLQPLMSHISEHYTKRPLPVLFS